MASPSQHDSLGLLGCTLGGKYRVDRVIAEGGSGIVYQAQNVVLGEPVAIKCIKPGDGTREAFLKEAKSLYSFAHPNVVRLYDTGEHEGPRGPLFYVVLEYLEGTTLDQEIATRAEQQRPFSLGEQRTMIGAVLEALAAAHARGLVHRDMKPSNIMLVDGGTVKVLDFGTARLVTQATKYTSHFTPRYAAPEQWEPDRGATSPATDVHAVGLILYETMTLTPALAGSSLPEILKACLATQRPSVVARRPELAGLVQPMLDRALALDPSARYPDAAAMLLAVQGRLATGAARHVPVLASTTPLVGAPRTPPPSFRGTLPLSGPTITGRAGVPPGAASTLRMESSTPLPAPRPAPRPLDYRRMVGIWLALAIVVVVVVGGFGYLAARP